MRRILVHRLLISIPLLLFVTLLTFVLASITPGNAARAILGTTSSPEAVRKLEVQLGLNKPIYVQYWHWLSGLGHGSLGSSVFNGEPVATLLNQGLPITLTLIIGAVVGSLVIGVPLGVISARRPGPLGRVVDALSLVGFALPAFWLGLILVLLFSTKLHWFPPSGWVSPSASLTGWFRSMFLPVITLAVAGASIVAKQMRDGMSSAMNREFIRSLRARGLSERSIVYKHAMRSALPNVVTLIGLYVVSLLLGTTLVELVFALQGLGSLAVNATTQHDLTLLEGTALYFTLIVIVTFTAVDLVQAWLNPKLRQQ